jgi:hypothetical protein
VTLAGREEPLPVGLRLFLPDEWIKDPERDDSGVIPGGLLTAQGEALEAFRLADELLNSRAELV